KSNLARRKLVEDTRISRRRFLQVIAGAGGLALLSACGGQVPSTPAASAPAAEAPAQGGKGEEGSRSIRSFILYDKQGNIKAIGRVAEEYSNRVGLVPKLDERFIIFEQPNLVDAQLHQHLHDLVENSHVEIHSDKPTLTRNIRP